MVRLISRLRAVIGLRVGGVFLFLMSLGTGADLLSGVEAWTLFALSR
jgi:hypothetical protein